MKTTQRLLEMRRRESVYILLVQMSPRALKMQENGDVNVSYKYNNVFKKNTYIDCIHKNCMFISIS